MKLNHLSRLTARKSLVSEGIQGLNERAGEELDGILDDIETDNIETDDIETDDIETDDILDLGSVESDEPIEGQEKQGFTIQHARDQLNGMVSRWFEIAKSISPEKREPFLKLGDRISEIIDVIESEFLNA